MTRAKLRLVQFFMEHTTRPQDAERYLGEVIATKATDMQPQAYGWLVQLLSRQGRYEEAASAAQIALSSYPYSTWSDYTAYTFADTLYRAGKKEQALAAADQMFLRFPDSLWLEPLRQLKEIFWK